MSKQHDKYGKELLKNIGGFSSSFTDCKIKYGEKGNGARIDGVIGVDIAIEIESRVNKQIRGAILDLILHPNPKKLLILIKVHMKNIDITKSQSEFILNKYIKNDNFRVIVLDGNGDGKKEIRDKKIIEDAIKDLKEND